MTGQSLLRTSTRTLEDNVGPVSTSQFADRGNDITGFGVQGMIRT